MLHDILKIILHDGLRVALEQVPEGGFRLPQTDLRPGRALRQVASRLALERFGHDVPNETWEVVDSNFDNEKLFSTYVARARVEKLVPHEKMMFFSVSADWNREPVDSETRARLPKILRGV